MLARQGTFECDPTQLDRVIAHFRDRVVPMYRELPGFVGYESFVDRATGHYVGYSYWQDEASYRGSTEAGRIARAEAAEIGARIVGEPLLLEVEFDTRSVGNAG